MGEHEDDEVAEVADFLSADDEIDVDSDNLDEHRAAE